MIETPFYDPEKSYEANFEEGPFGAFADGEVIKLQGNSEYDFFGTPIALPFGIPAGPLLNGKYVKAALDKGFGLPIYKTVRTRQKKSHPHPNVLPVDLEGDLTLEKADQGLTTKETYTEPLSITNSFGVPSFDPDFWQQDVADSVTYAKEGQVVGASFEGTRWDGFSEEDYIRDWADAAKLLKDTKVGFIEANLSCPNEGTTSLLCFDAERVGKIARGVRDAVGDIPFFLKISYFTDEAVLEALVKEVGGVVDGFATINTISAEVRTPSGEQALPGEGRLRSGVCGYAIRWAGLDMVRRLGALREKYGHRFKIMGVGGVVVPEDFGMYMSNGADYVMSATGAMWNPYLARDIAKHQ